MKNIPKPLAIDVSHILAWQGRLTGIERVEHHIINYYFGKEAVRFVTWDPAINSFIVLGNKAIEDLILLRPNQDNLPVGSQTSIRKVFVRADKLMKKIRTYKPVEKAYAPAP